MTSNAAMHSAQPAQQCNSVKVTNVAKESSIFFFKSDSESPRHSLDSISMIAV
jgi:hypothetical protein